MEDSQDKQIPDRVYLDVKSMLGAQTSAPRRKEIERFLKDNAELNGMKMPVENKLNKIKPVKKEEQ